MQEGNTLRENVTLRNAPQIRLHEPPLPENQSLGYFLSHSCFVAPVQEKFQSLLTIKSIINQVASSYLGLKVACSNSLLF
jgi:hypothetical protein